MSGQTPSKDDADVSPKSSWEIISESENSRSNSIETISTEECDQVVSENSTVDTAFIAIPEADLCRNKNDTLIDMPVDNTEIKPKEKTTKKSKEKTTKKPSIRFKKRRRTDTFTALSIAASVLTITGLTLLFFMLPTQAEQQSLEKIQTDYIDLIRGTSKNIQANFNSTSELFNKLNHIKEDIFEEQCYLDNEVCLANSSEQFVNLNSPEEPVIDPSSKLKTEDIIYDKPTLHDITSTTSSLLNTLKGVCTNSSLHVFLCTLMQDVCLIKLVNQLEKKHNLYEKLQQSEEKKSQKKEKIKKQPKKIIKTKNETKVKTEEHEVNTQKNSTTKDISVGENGKSECERRFEELENKWKSAGKNHLLKMQQIKQQYKTELYQLQESEKDAKRQQKVKLLRENYIQKLKADRERYLTKLRKIKDERQRAMNEICKINKIENEHQSNIKEKMHKIEHKEDGKNEVQKKISPINSPYDDYANFWKNLTHQPTSEEPIKLKLKKKPLRKPKNTTELNRTMDDRTEIALIEEIVTKIMYNLTDLRNKNDSNSVPPSSRNKYSNKPKKRDGFDKETLVSKFAPSTYSTPASVSKVTIKNGSSNGLKKFLKTNPNVYENTTKTVSLPPLTYPSSHELIDNESESESNKTNENSPLLENFSFTTIAKRNQSKEVIDSLAPKPEINKKGAALTWSNNDSYSFDTDKKEDEGAKWPFLPARSTSNETYSFNKNSPRPLSLLHMIKKKKVVSNDKEESLNSKSEIIPTDGVLEFNITSASEEKAKIEEEFDFTSSPARYKPIEEKIEKTENVVKNELQLVVRDTPTKQDIYSIVFDKDGERIKKEEILRKQSLQRYATQPQIHLLSKQAPKLPKKVYLFKGRL